MSEEKTTLHYFKDLVDALNHIAERLDGFNRSIKQDAEEIDKLSDIIDELRDEKANMQTKFHQMIERGGFDLSPCIDCGESVVCVPEGLALCKTCAEKGGEA